MEGSKRDEKKSERGSETVWNVKEERKYKKVWERGGKKLNWEEWE